MAIVDYSAWAPWDYKSALGLVQFTNPTSGILGELGAGTRDIVSPDRKYTLTMNADGQATAINGSAFDKAENMRYYGAGLLDPRLYEAATNYANTPDKLDDYLAGIYQKDPYEAAYILGRLNDRGSYSTGSGDPISYDPTKYWPAVFGGMSSALPGDPTYRTELAKSLGLSAPQAQQTADWWTQYNSSSAQSARDDPDEGLFGLGDFGTLLGLGALAFGIPYGLEALGWGGLGAEAGAAGLIDGAWLGEGLMSGIPAWDAAYSAALAGGAGTLGGSMDWGDLFSGLGDTTADLGSVSGSDLSALLDGYAGGGGATADWWSSVLSPSSNYSLSDIAGILGGSGGSSLSNLTKLFSGDSGGSSGLLSGALTGLGGYLTGNSAVDAARATADAQIRAAQIAADAAKFKPVGVTTNFGSSQFGYDAKGNLTSAGYQLTPEMLAQQAKLMGVSEEALQQYMQSKGLTQPMQTAAQQAMTLGNNYLQTTPEQQAAKYMAEQQSLLAPSRERELALLQTKLANQGVGGLAMGATSTGMQAANPQLEAYYNALMQQDTQLAANATQGGMDYAKFGAGMVGTGGDLLKGMYGTQTAAYAPYQTALGGAQTIEGLGQNALTLGMNLGSTVTAANANAGNLLAQGMNNAAQTTQAANAYSPWGALLTGAGNTMQNYSTQQQLLNLLSGSGTSGWGT